jgi:hypothetical protein
MKSLSGKLGVILFIIGLIIFGNMEVWGADWKFTGKDSLENVWEIDAAGISRQSNNVVRVLVKTTYSKKGINRFVKEFGEEFKNLSYCTRLEEYNCTEEKTRTLGINWYSLRGGVMYSVKSPTEWEFVIRGSIGEDNLKAACEQPKKQR